MSLSSSSNSRDEKSDVKDESLDMSVRDILAQAKAKEAKKEPQQPAAGTRTRKQIVRTDIESSKQMGSGVYFNSYSSSPFEEQEGVAIDSNEVRCIPVRVPFDKDGTCIQRSDNLIDEGIALIQMPDLFPTLVPPQSLEGSPSHPSAKRRGKTAQATPVLSPTTGTLFSEIPDGRIGTLKIHKSGKAVLHVGSTQLSVTRGQETMFRSEVACVCPAEDEIIFLGEVTKRLVVSPVIS